MLTISEVAERSGFAATTLRYYEQLGLITPRRTTAGQRRYDDAHLQELRFIADVKRLGLSLQEVGEALMLWREGDCHRSRARLAGLLDAKLAEVRAERERLEAFEADLQEARAALVRVEGPATCEPGCLCPPEVTVDAPEGRLLPTHG